MAGPWEDYKSTQGNPWEQYGGAPTGEPSGDIVKRATEPGLGTKIYDLVLGRPQGNYPKSVSEAVSIAAPQQGGDVSGGIVDYLAPKVGANVAAAVGTADKTLRPLYNLPETAGRGAMAAMGGLWEGSYAPTAIRHGAGAAGDLVEYGTGSKVAGDIAANAINYPAQFLAPGGIVRGAQVALQKGLPHVAGAQSAMHQALSERFGQASSSKMLAAGQREEIAKAAYEGISDTTRIPMTNTLKHLQSAIGAEEAGGPLTGAIGELKRLGSRITANGGTLSKQELMQEMSEIGRNTNQLATQGVKVDASYNQLFAIMMKDAGNKAPGIIPTKPLISGIASQETELVEGLINAPTRAQQMAKTSIVQKPYDQQIIEIAGQPLSAGAQQRTGKLLDDAAATIRTDLQGNPTLRSAMENIQRGTSDRALAKKIGGVLDMSKREAVQVSQPSPSRLTTRYGATEEKVTGLLPEEALIEKTSVPGPGVRFGQRPAPYRSEGQRMNESDANRLLNVGNEEVSYTAGQKVIDYRTASRERKSYEDINSALQKLVRAKQGFDNEFTNFSGPRMLNWLKDRPKIVEGIPEPDMIDLEKILIKMAELPAIPPPSGVMYGSGRAFEASAGVGGLLMLLGVSPPVAAGASGTLAGLVAASRVLLPTRVGRKAVAAVLEAGPINQLQIDMLNSLARSVATGNQISDEIKKALRTDVPLQVKQQLGMTLANPQP